MQSIRRYIAMADTSGKRLSGRSSRGRETQLVQTVPLLHVSASAYGAVGKGVAWYAARPDV